MDIVTSVDCPHLPWEGVDFRRNPGNGFAVIDIHFTADPDKRGAEWIRESKRGMPAAEWAREFDLQWIVFAGTPVFPDFTKDTHIHDEDMRPNVRIPLVRGWDFGLTPSCVILQLAGGRITIHDELHMEDMSITQFAPIAFEHCSLYYPGYRWLDYCDPAGFQRKDTDERTCAQVLSTVGNIQARPGEMGIEKRLQAVEHFLCNSLRGKPRLMINPSCQWLIDAFSGGYHFPDKPKSSRAKQKRIPNKNEYSHAMDALQYALSRIRRETRRLSRVANIPVPSYGFSVQRGHTDARVL